MSDHDQGRRVGPDHTGNTRALASPSRGAQPTAEDRASDRAATPRDVNEFERLAPLFERFVRLDENDPVRSELREQLVRGFSPLVGRLASRYRNRGEPVEDLEQAGMLGLLNAVDRFHPDKGSFLGFAVPTITGEIRRHFRDRTWSVHVPRSIRDLQTRMGRAQDELSSTLGRAPRVSELAAQLELSREEVIDALAAQQSYRADSLDVPLGESGAGVGDLIGDVDTRFDLVDARESLRPVIAELPERERTILQLRFFEHMTQTQIAARVGLSQMHVSRLLTQILATIREGVSAGPTQTQPTSDVPARDGPETP